MGVTYVEEKWYSIATLVRAFEYFVLSQSNYNRVRQNIQLLGISTIIKMTSKVKTIVQLFLVH